jgi:hypothetical protein
MGNEIESSLTGEENLCDRFGLEPLRLTVSVPVNLFPVTAVQNIVTVCTPDGEPLARRYYAEKA